MSNANEVALAKRVRARSEQASLRAALQKRISDSFTRQREAGTDFRVREALDIFKDVYGTPYWVGRQTADVNFRVG